MPFTVFISHSVSDLAVVNELRYWLEENGIPTYVAEAYPEPGVRLSDKIASAIAASDCVLALMTYDGERSQWVHQEVGYAKAQGKLIIPVVEEGTTLKGFIEDVEYITFRRYDPYQAITSVVQSLSAVKFRKEEEKRKAIAGLMVFFGLLALGIAISKEQ